MTPKIGIGLCTYNRPDMAIRVAKAVRETTNSIYFVCSIDGGNIGNYDIEGLIGYCDEVIIGKNQGVIRNKNRLLAYLQNCDYIFLMDDDLIPLKSGWIEIYIEALRCTGYEHINYIHDLAKSVKITEKSYSGGVVIEYYKDLGGALMLMSKKCVEKVGIFDPEYKFYGYGHCDYTRRCQMAGLYPPVSLGHPHVKGIDPYLMLDMSVPTVTEDSVKKIYIEKNGARYNGGSPAINIPLRSFFS
jgi:GT2 family glycosyltransferase